MQITNGDRASGKSTHVVRWVAQDPSRRAAVVAEPHSAEYLARVARTMYPEWDVDWEKKFLAVTRLTANSLRGRGLEVYVDEVDDVLSKLIGASVAGATVSGEVYDLGKRPDAA